MCFYYRNQNPGSCLSFLRSRRRKYWSALLTLSSRTVLVLGCTTLLVWFFVDKTEILRLYYLYCLGYSAVVLFQVGGLRIYAIHGLITDMCLL